MKPVWLWLHQKHYYSDQLGLEWKFVTPKFRGIFYYQKWEVEEGEWSVERQIPQTPITTPVLRAISHLFILIIRFSRNIPVGKLA